MLESKSIKDNGKCLQAIKIKSVNLPKLIIIIDHVLPPLKKWAKKPNKYLLRSGKSSTTSPMNQRKRILKVKYRALF